MPERNDTPKGPGGAPEPIDEAYLRAEQALDDEGARAARRARVLAAVAEAPAAASPPPLRRPVRRYGGWLAAACVAGLSVWTAQRVYRPAPRQEAAPAKAPALAEPAAPPAAPFAPAKPVAPPPSPGRSPATRDEPAVRAVEPAPPPPPPPAPAPPRPPPADIAPPPPLPIPPVERPIAQPPAFAPAPPSAKSGASAQDVIVGGSRIAPRAFPAAPGVVSAEAQAPDGGARLRAAASAGRTADIEALLAQGVPVDAADKQGETALMNSIEAGQRDAAAVLRRHGASLDLKNRAGVSAREMAGNKGDAGLDQALGLPGPVSPSGATPP